MCTAHSAPRTARRSYVTESSTWAITGIRTVITRVELSGKVACLSKQC